MAKCNELDSKEAPTILKIHLKHSKCDQCVKGVNGLPLYPVSAVLDYLALWQDNHGPLFDLTHRAVSQPVSIVVKDFASLIIDFDLIVQVV